MKIAIAQIDCSPGEVDTNVAHMKESVRQASKAGCELVVLPEMSDTGYWPEKHANCAQPWQGGACSELMAAAAENSIGIVAGLSEREGDLLYNSLAFIGPAGDLLCKYRKIHLYSASSACEATYFTPGTELGLVDFGGIRWGLSICYDLRFPEIYRLLSSAGAEVLINVAAWPSARPTHWDYLSRARAIENQAFVVAANRAGEDGPFDMLGQSRIISPMGKLLAEAGSGQQLITADIDLQLAKEFRAKVPALADRQPELYKSLESNL